MTAPVNTRPDLVQIRRHETTQSSFGFAEPEVGSPETLPPRTRGECPKERPCPRTACRWNMRYEYETEGRPHNGVHTTPKTIERDGSQAAVSCVLDEVDGLEDGEVVDLARTSYVLGVDARRVQQLLDRGLNKQWAAMSLTEVIEAWAEAQLYPKGGRIEVLYSVVVDEQGQKLQRMHDPHAAWVTIGIDVRALERPAVTEAAKRVGVAIRKRGTR